MSISNQEQKIKVIQQEINEKQSSCNGTKGCPDDPFCGSINFSACGRINLLKSAMREEQRKLAVLKKAKANREVNEIKRKQIIPEITPKILPSIVATSSLIPLGIIILLLVRKW